MIDGLRKTVRKLWRNPGFTSIALLTLALGTGVNVTIFGILNRVVLRPLPFPEADRLVAVSADLPGNDDLGLSGGDALELERSSNAFESLGWVERPSLSDVIVLTGDEPERISGAWVTADYFGVLGVQPFVGRLFEAGEDRLGGARTAVLAYGAWQTRWGGDRSLIGRTIPVNGEPVTVVGVLPPDARIPLGGDPPEVWLAMPYSPEFLESREAWITDVVARLRPDATLMDARREVDAFGASVRERFPDSHGNVRFVVTPLHESWVGDVRRPLQLLFASALLVLLVACVNLGILVASRNAARGEEVAVRRALGAGGYRLARSILGESLVLGVSGTVLGVLIAVAIGGTVRAWSPVDLPRIDGPLVDVRLVLFTALTALAVAVGVGIAPIVRTLRTSPASLLGTRGTRTRTGPAHVLVGAESAVVLALLVAAMLTTQGLTSLLAIDPGFSPDGRLMGAVSVPVDLTWRAPGGTERNRLFFRQARDRLLALPGVEAVGFVTNPPLTPAGWGGALWLYGEPASDPQSIDWEMAGVGYFEAVGIDVIEGRTFAETDDADAPSVAVVNETLARRYFTEGDAVGRVVSGSNADGPWRTIVGVVGDVYQQSLGQPETRPQMYIPALQGFAFDRHYMVMRVRGDPLAHIEAVRAAVNDLEPDAVVDDIRPMHDLVRRSAATSRFHAIAFGLFAGIATLLGLSGVYGVVSDTLLQRRREIAVRVALGAAPRTVLVTEIRRGLVPVLGGIGVGTGIALAGTRVARGVITGMDAFDPFVVAAAAAALVLVATLAILGPALRASATPPSTALRKT